MTSNRSIGLLLFGTGTSLLGDGMLAIAVAFAIFELGGSAMELGVIVGAGALTIFACILPAGMLADRGSRRALAVGSDVLRAASQLAAGALVLTDAPSVWLLLPTTVLFGIGTAVHQPATVGFVADVVPPHRLVRVNGIIQGLRGVSMVAGAAVGGWLVEAYDAGIVLVADGTTFLVCAVAYACIRTPARAVVHDVASMRVRDAFSAARRLPWVLPGMLLVSGFVFAMLGPMQVVGPSLARASGEGASLWSAVSTALAVGMVLGGGSTAAGLVRAPLAATRVLLVLGTSGHLALAAHAPLAVTLPGYAALGAAMGVYAANWEANKQLHVPRATLSRIGALDWFLNLVGMMAGVALGSIVTAAASPETTLRIMVVATLALVAATFVSRPLRDVMATRASVGPLEPRDAECQPPGHPPVAFAE